MADSVYHGRFKAVRNGTKTNRITLKGSKKAILTNPGSDGFVFYNMSYWILEGFSVFNVSRAIVLDFSSNILLNKLNLSYSDEAAVKFRNNSTDNTIQNSRISYTGRKAPQNGEAVYIGAAFIHWIHNFTGPDRSNRNKVTNNFFGPNITAESVDIKEGVDNIIVANNTINGFGKIISYKF